MTTTTHRQPLSPDAPAIGIARRRLVRVASIIGASLLAWLVLIVTDAAGIEVVAPAPSGMAPVAGPTVLVAVLIAGMLGWLVLAALERLAPRRGRTVWTVGAIVIGVLSVLAGPTAAATIPAAVVLASLHLLVTTVIVLGFRLSTRV